LRLAETANAVPHAPAPMTRIFMRRPALQARQYLRVANKSKLKQ
jgi:hypothetical protein